MMGVSAPLGPLTFLRVWHDNTGKSKKASWFLDKVVITDVQTSDMWVALKFLKKKWSNYIFDACSPTDESDE